MHDTEAQQLLLEIIEYAQEAKPSEFHLIVNWEDYKYYCGKARSYKLLVKGLNKSANRLFKKYCKSVTVGISNFTTLLAYQRLIQTLEFYQKELATVQDMIDEYITYLFDGNLFWSFIGFQRPDKDMRDFRRKD